MQTRKQLVDARASMDTPETGTESRPVRRLTASTVRAVRGGHTVRTGIRAGMKFIGN